LPGLAEQPFGIGRLAAAIIQHAVAVIDMIEHAIAGDDGVHLLVPRIHIDGVIGIEEGNPVAHAAL
jgi:hypothetical protein